MTGGPLRALARRAAILALGGGPLMRLRLRRIERTDPLVILGLHRVAPPDSSAYRPLDPAMFDALLGFVTRHFTLTGFAVAREPSPRPRMILTFDDGYRDFAQHAMPLLKRHGVRVNLNVIPSSVESGLPPLQVLAADFVGQAPPEVASRIELPGFDMSDRRGLWPRLDTFLRDRPHEEQQRIGASLLAQFRAWDGFRPTPMMSRDEVREAAEEGHEIGGHSFDHASMGYATDDYLLDDVERCRSWIADATGRPMRVYAFPNGSHRPGQAEKVRSAGIEHVLLSGPGFGSADGIHQRLGFVAATRREMRFRALGGMEPVALGRG